MYHIGKCVNNFHFSIFNLIPISSGENKTLILLTHFIQYYGNPLLLDTSAQPELCRNPASTLYMGL